ncbi:MAG: polysaccharide deacetylase family protein [Chitinophagaceae bacterium]|nr:polysaccharide deacetylase family protein [Chitinophagaceae bacterium]
MLLRNFLFHRVSEETDSMWPPMKPELFSRIIQHLTKNYTVVSLEEYLADPPAFSSAKKIATVMFDDGYKDNIEYAAPILRQFKCPASFYVVTDCIDRNVPTWTYIVDNVFQQTKKASIELPFDYVPGPLKSVDLKGAGKEQQVRQVKPWMKYLTNMQRKQIMHEIITQCNDVLLPSGKMMSWSDIGQLSTQNFIIGSHSHTHPLLASLADEKEISDELRVSYQRIKEKTGKSPATISYPIGSFDERVMKIAQQEGYLYGLAVEQKFFQFGRDNLFAIPRVELYQESWWKTVLRMKGIYSNLKQLWR